MRAHVTLRPLDAELLTALLDAAVADAEPAEVMPPVPGPPGWTDARRAAFTRFHRGRCHGLAPDPVEWTYAVLCAGRVVGAARLCPASEEGDGVLEAGLWLGRTARGAGVGGAALHRLLDRARALGGRWVLARTTSGNAAACRALNRLGGALTTGGASGDARDATDATDATGGDADLVVARFRLPPPG
ncbi:GNAT family N-acetyltransferase [Streptomyces sp. TRM70308]|uniref:GNAT family N-acetyltransferase n=1 Tax=Streptomyces sp. TRM70308 TaxID=3131932 RepID=UPI003D065848